MRRAKDTLVQRTRRSARPDVVCIVNEVIAAGRLTWPCDLRVTSPASPVRCRLHPVLLCRIVSNVLDNAARAAGPSGVVTVQIRQRKALVTLVVEDSGPGLAKSRAAPASARCRGPPHRETWRRRRPERMRRSACQLRPPQARVGGGAKPMRLVLCDDNRILCEALAVTLEGRGDKVLATETTTLRGSRRLPSTSPTHACSI